MKRYALCIGNNDYKILSKLSSAAADAEAVGDKLKKLGFDVDTAFDLERDELNSRITDLSYKIDEYDSIIFYYAGHGFQMENENILVPIDFNIYDEPRTAGFRAIR